MDDNKKYNIILADPPWKYERGDMHTGHRSTDHYPSMDKEELMSLNVPSVCANECVLYMWATGPKLDWALEIGKAWGFQYSQVAFVWDKMRTLAGCYTITECEYVLVFRHKKHKLPKRFKTNVRQFFQEKPREHSRKPEYVQDMLELMYPNAEKLELFARRSRDGWDVWGNETNKFDSDKKVIDDNIVNVV